MYSLGPGFGSVSCLQDTLQLLLWEQIVHCHHITTLRRMSMQQFVTPCAVDGYWDRQGLWPLRVMTILEHVFWCTQIILEFQLSFPSLQDFLAVSLSALLRVICANGEKIFVVYLISVYYLEYLRNLTTKRQTTQSKNDQKTWNRHFFKEDTESQQAPKSCSTSLVAVEMQIKVTVR